MSETVMTERTTGAHPQPRARITGVVYLLFFLTTISAELLVRGLVVADNATATANNILAHGSLFRLHVAGGLIAIALYIGVTVLFYDLFKPVNRSLALMAAFFSVVGCAIQAVGTLFQLAPLVLLEDRPYLGVFKPEQLQALALLSLKFNGEVAGIGLFFFGLFNLSIGCLIFRSTFLPRALGVLMALSGLGWLTLLSPPFAHHVLPIIEILGILAEALLMLWLLVRGVNVQRWKEQVIAAGHAPLS